MHVLKEDELETDDIYQAAYYKLAGCEYRRRRKDKDGRKVYFVFANPGGDMREMREKYFSGEGKVSAYDYSKDLKRYKELCFE